jgi:drug/metabolite transporter (DMT)-like permease
VRPIDALRLTTLGAIWGSSFLLIKLALEGFAPLQIVAARMALGAGVLILLVAARGRALPRRGDTWRALAFMAVVANILPFFLIAWGEERIDSGLAAILNSTTPLFTALLAAVLLHGERSGAVRSAGILLGFVGVGTIVGIDAEPGSLAGELAVVLASLSYAVGFVYARRRLTHREHSPLELSAAQLLLGTAVIIPVSSASLPAHMPVFDATPVLALGALGAVGTGLAYIIYYRLIHDVGATTASFVTYLIPLFGVFLGWIVLDERLGWNALAGAVMIIAGIAIAEAGKKRIRAAAPALESDAPH